MFRELLYPWHPWVPAWMFDRTACAEARLTAAPYVSAAALLALCDLLRHALKGFVKSCTRPPSGIPTRPKLKAVNETPALERSTLTPPDLAFVMTKHHGNRLGFAVLLAFFRNQGRFPRTASEIDQLFVAEIAQQLAIAAPSALRRAWRGGPLNGIVPKSAPWLAFERRASPMRRCSKIG